MVLHNGFWIAITHSLQHHMFQKEHYLNRGDKLSNMEKYANTLKMMGVPLRDCVEFSDAINNYHKTVSQNVKKSQLTTMLNTVVMDKTFKEWFIHLAGDDCSNIDFTDTFQFHSGNIHTLFEMVLQIFYKKEKVLG